MVDKMKKLFLVIGVGIVFGAGIFILCSVFDYDDIYDNINVWYKVSTDEFDLGEVIALDMSNGYSTSDPNTIYLIVNNIDSTEQVVVVFPNGGYWEAPTIDTTSIEIQKIFGKLKQDLNGK